MAISRVWQEWQRVNWQLVQCFSPSSARRPTELFYAKKKIMEKFPDDVRIAEGKTNGDPSIVDREEFQPEEKPNIASIFGEPSRNVKRASIGQAVRGRKRESLSESPASKRAKVSLSGGRASFRAMTNGIDTHISSNRQNVPKSAPTTPLRSTIAISASSASANRDPNLYICHKCNFKTARLNLFVYHNKSHIHEGSAPKPSPGKLVLSMFDSDSLDLWIVSIICGFCYSDPVRPTADAIDLHGDGVQPGQNAQEKSTPAKSGSSVCGARQR